MFWSLLFECSGSIFKSLRQHLNILFELLCIHNFKFKSSVGFRDELELYITEFCQLTTSLMMEWWSSATQRHLLAKVFFLFCILKCLISSWMESLRALGMTVWRDFDFSTLEWRDLQLNIGGMTVFALINSDGICTSLLPVFLYHEQYLAILQCHLSNENRKMILQETTLVNKCKNYLMHHELNWKTKNCILEFSIYQRDPHAIQLP